MLPANLSTVIEIQRERCQALLKEAQAAQLLAQVRHDQPTLWEDCLSHLGEWLIASGQWLKNQNKSAHVTPLGSN